MKERVVINDRVHLYRWTLFRCRWFQIVIHNFISDDPPDLHDHAWWNISIVLRGVLKETTQERLPMFRVPVHRSRYLRAGCVRIRSAAQLHRLSVVRGPVWTLFITGPARRQWGYDTDAGWVHWTAYRTKHNKSLRSKTVN